MLGNRKCRCENESIVSLIIVPFERETGAKKTQGGENSNFRIAIVKTDGHVSLTGIEYQEN